MSWAAISTEGCCQASAFTMTAMKPLLGLLLLWCFSSYGQTLVSSARVVCAPLEFFGPIVGLVSNQTEKTLDDLQVEVRVVRRDNKGRLHQERDNIVSVIPSLQESGVVVKLEPQQTISFNLALNQYDQTCVRFSDTDKVPNSALLAVVRVNGKSLLPNDSSGRPLKRAPIEMMTNLPRIAPQTPFTLQDLMNQNSMLRSEIMNRQLQDCLSGGTWACTFQTGANVNVIINR
jgi:hypothetical protein